MTKKPTSTREVDYKALLNAAPDLYLILDTRLVIIEVSQAYATATLTEREEIIGKPLFEVFPDNPSDQNADGVSNLSASLNYVLKNGRAHKMAVQKYDIRRPDGSFEERYWSPQNFPVFNQRGQLVSIIHRVEDVTAVLKAEEESEIREKDNVQLRGRLSEVEARIIIQAKEIQALNFQLESKIDERTRELLDAGARYKSTLDSMMEGAQILDFEYRYVYLNDAVVKQSKLNRDEMIGKTMMEKYPGIENTAMFALIKDCMTRRVSHSLDNRFDFPDGTFGWFQLSILPIDTGVFILSIDITAQKQAEMQLQALNTELEDKVIQRTTQLQAVNKELESFCYSVSHDLKAPLRALQGFSKLLIEKHASEFDEETTRWLNFILGNANRMDELIGDLLSLSKINRRDLIKAPCNMNEIVQEMYKQEKYGYKNNIEFTADELPWAQGDVVLLQLVWQNLIGNALKYSSLKETIKITITGTSEANFNSYSIEDNGAGFDMQYYNKLFGVFQRLHSQNEFPGNGVGLAIVQRIIARHGGNIRAVSQVGKGSTFTFILPK